MSDFNLARIDVNKVNEIVEVYFTFMVKNEGGGGSLVGIFDTEKEVVDCLIPNVIKNMGAYSCYFNHNDFISNLNEKRYKVVKTKKYKNGSFYYFLLKFGNKGKLINQTIKEKKPKKIKNLNELVLKTYKEYDCEISNDEILNKLVGVFDSPKKLVHHFIPQILDSMQEYVNFFNFKKFIDDLKSDYIVLNAPTDHLLLFKNF